MKSHRFLSPQMRACIIRSFNRFHTCAAIRKRHARTSDKAHKLFGAVAEIFIIRSGARPDFRSTYRSLSLSRSGIRAANVRGKCVGARVRVANIILSEHRAKGRPPTYGGLKRRASTPARLNKLKSTPAAACLRHRSRNN